MFGKSILFSEMTPGADWVTDFNHWYDTEHIPVRMVLDGFQGAQRYKSVDRDSNLVVYDMDSQGALKTPGYQVVKNQPSEKTRWMLQNVTGFTRYLADEIGNAGKLDQRAEQAPVLFTAMFTVPEEELANFDAWYVEDHIPILLECTDWLAVRRFAVTSAEPGTYNRLAIHYLNSDAALSSPQRERARNTPWRNRMAANDWFKEGYYATFNRLGRRFDGAAK
ncbi:DUF4286 family protein [Herbaspirillum sp. RV1423]|uniref:DUF4286 family protein n=1 Tax=Herbaspirillum sp. RV1423 TaxID=1443993 RepID=UPI0004AD1040|nr:DUF4286 family protein [Herbaspirillum sp. RV1423]